MISPDNEEVTYDQFKMWLKYAQANHSSALQILEWLMPMVVSQSNRAEEARVKLGEDYGEIPDNGMNPLVWIVNGYSVDNLRHGGFERGEIAVKPTAEQVKEDLIKGAWANLSAKGAKNRPVILPPNVEDPTSIPSDGVRGVMVEPPNGIKKPRRRGKNQNRR